MTQRTIFLSLVSDEFRSYRELLTRDLERCQVEVSTQEKWGTLGLTTLDKLDHFIQKLKQERSAVVHVVGDGLGHVPPKAAVDELLARHPDFLPHISEHAGLTREQLAACSYTQWEALPSSIKFACTFTGPTKTPPTKARELVEAHGYGRRREELADAEAAAKAWSIA